MNPPHEINIDHVAHLARIDLTAAERERFAPQLAAIIGYVDQLGTLDTSSIEATFQVLPLSNVMRDDRLVAGLSNADALLNAPRAEEGCFRVPRIL
jgi:aspartyl-tRNA(Asn)/glutamyl-tRNA(Gln) amidotransferase subunit C